MEAPQSSLHYRKIVDKKPLFELYDGADILDQKERQIVKESFSDLIDAFKTSIFPGGWPKFSTSLKVYEGEGRNPRKISAEYVEGNLILPDKSTVIQMTYYPQTRNFSLEYSRQIAFELTELTHIGSLIGVLCETAPQVHHGAFSTDISSNGRLAKPISLELSGHLEFMSQEALNYLSSADHLITYELKSLKRRD